MAASVSLLGEAWTLVNSAKALFAQDCRAALSALFAVAIFASSLGVVKLATSKFEVATVIAFASVVS